LRLLAASPVVARAQQADRLRRIGVLINFAADDPAARSRLDTFLAGLQSLGWIDGRNVHIDIRWGAGGVNKVQFYAAELVSLRTDVIFANGVTSVTALQRETTSIPIVSVQLADPVCIRFGPSLKLYIHWYIHNPALSCRCVIAALPAAL
jgi:ABC-type uncharacterized transport system substrate-binding protein